MVDPAAIRARYEALLPHLDERGRRVFAASEARSAEYGGIVAVSRATGVAASTIGRGLDELADTARLDADRVRRPGSGRKLLAVTDALLMDDLLCLVSPGERGRPDVAAALDVQEFAPVGGRTGAAGSPGQPHRDRRVAEALQVQPASQSQDP